MGIKINSDTKENVTHKIKQGSMSPQQQEGKKGKREGESRKERIARGKGRKEQKNPFLKSRVPPWLDSSAG